MNKAQPHLHACSECDLLITMPEVISHRANVRCPRCNHSIAVEHNNARHYVVAYSFTVLILMFLAFTFSFISFSSNGQIRTINLVQSFTQLYSQEFYFVAFLVFAFILLLPTLYLVSVCLIILSSYKNVEFVTLNQWFNKTILIEPSLKNIIFPSIDYKNFQELNAKFKDNYN